MQLAFQIWKKWIDMISKRKVLGLLVFVFSVIFFPHSYANSTQSWFHIIPCNSSSHSHVTRWRTNKVAFGIIIQHLPSNTMNSFQWQLNSHEIPITTPTLLQIPNDSEVLHQICNGCSISALVDFICFGCLCQLHFFFYFFIYLFFVQICPA